MLTQNSPFSRALIIRKEWLDKVFVEDKLWELRSRHTNIRGCIGLIEAGSGEVKGIANITDSIGPLAEKELKENVDKHKVTDFALVQKWNHAWVFDDVIKYDKPIPYQHPKGAVTWVKFN